MQTKLTKKQLTQISESREASRHSATVLAIRTRNVCRMTWVMIVHDLKTGNWDSDRLALLADPTSLATLAVDLTEAVELLNSPFTKQGEPWEKKYKVKAARS